jgi:large subunit ribosomal protein L35
MEHEMPKMKTKSGAKKRFTVTATGKVKFKQAHSRHRLISKPQKMKRKARGTAVMFHSDGDKVLDYFMPNTGVKRRRVSGVKVRVANDNASWAIKPVEKKLSKTAAKFAAKTTATKKPAAKKAAAKAGE